MTENAVPRGASLTIWRASSIASWKAVWLPPFSPWIMVIEVEASMTRATSRPPSRRKRFKLSWRSITTAPTASKRQTIPAMRTMMRVFSLDKTTEPARAATPSRTRGNTTTHGTDEFGGTKGRAIASAIKVSMRQRVAISRRSSHSILRRRMATVSNRNRMAPHFIGLAA